jgi:RimJ/RimL family protein N-acetyltransferase
MARVDVHLRAVEDGDVELFFEHQKDEEAVRVAAFPARERDAFLAHWARIRADPTAYLRTVLADGRVAGNVVSWEQSGRRLVGYWIGRDFWGRGVATEALALSVREQASRPLYAYVAVHNVGSIRVLEKCGFQRVAAADLPPDDVAEYLYVLGAGDVRSGR